MSNNLSAEEFKETDNSLTEQEKEKKKNKTKKVVVTTTYFITVLCLLAGLFVPLFNCVEGVELPARMMFRYLPDMLNGIFGRELIPIAEGSWFLHYSYDSGMFNFISLVSILYAVVCVLSILMLIPVFLGSKKRNTSGNCALVVEILALIVLISYIAYQTYILVNTEVLGWTDFNFIIAFGGTLLMAIIQSIAIKGSIGVSKTLAVIFSAIGIIALLDITLFIPALSEGLNSLSQILQSGNKANFIGGLFEESEIGIYGITSLFNIKQAFESLGSKGNALYIVLYVIWILIAIFTVLNMVFDIIGLGTGKKYNKDRSPARNSGSNTFAIVRYVLTFVLTVAAIIFAILLTGITAGIYLYLLAIVLFIQIINAVARTIAAKRRCKKGALAPTEDAPEALTLVDTGFENTEEPVYADPYAEPVVAAEQPVAEEQPIYEEAVAPVYAEPAAEAQPVDYTQPIDYTPVPEESLIPDNTVVPVVPEQEEESEPSTVYVYGGDTDEFMETLTDAEKIEFVDVFIKKSKGTVNGVPDYVIHEDNSEFFPNVFIHINRYRNIVSDGLMQKMYRQLGKVM